MINSRRRFLLSGGATTLVLATQCLRARSSLPESSNPDLPQGNPIVTGRGLCDPHVRIFGEQAYLYATHDAVPGSRDFIMNDWWVWRSPDLVHWEQVSTLKPEDTYWRKPSPECWATDAISRNGKYYFYFSRGPEEIGVVEGNTPAGPWRDPLGKPLIAKGSTPTLARDPGIFQEKDGTSYIVFGCWDYYLARLNDDMISLAETPRLIRLDRKMGPYGPGKLDDKPYLHKRNGIYYLSWGCYYAMSDRLYGPYVYKDSVLKSNRTAPEFRKRLTFDRHGSFFEFKNQWYFICNDQDWPGTSEFYRDSVISYVHYRNNGEIETVDLNRLGVGRYDAREPHIEAANYFSGAGVTVRECLPSGYEVRDIQDGSSLVYSNLSNIPPQASLLLQYASGNPGGATVEIRDGRKSNQLLGSCKAPFTGGWESYQSAVCRLTSGANEVDLCLTFRGGKGELLRLKWLSF